MASTRWTVVLDMSEELMQELSQQAEDGAMTLGELLIGHACATALNTMAARGDMVGWRRLMRLWRQQCPGQVPELNIEGLFETP